MLRFIFFFYFHHYWLELFIEKQRYENLRIKSVFLYQMLKECEVIY